MLPTRHIAAGASLRALTVFLALVAALTVAAPAQAAPPEASASGSSGSVRLLKDGGSSFDRFTRRPSRAVKRFLRRHFARMVVHTPYFDRRQRWYPRGLVYRDLYGVFPGSRVARRHPRWLLRDSSGRPMYLPFDCAAGRCPQFAGDITNPAFRRAWIRGAKRIMRKGYLGLYIDDVNMIRRVSLGNAREVAPTSPRTGRRISRAAWRRAVVRFAVQIRRAVPTAEIVHNQIWFSPRRRDPLSRRLIRAANVIGLERGVNDAGLTRSGRFGLSTFLRHVDFIHRMGRSVLFDEEAPSAQQREYGLAGYLLINGRRDLLASEPFTQPDAFWRGYRVRLGDAKGDRYRWRGLLRRDFARGSVVLNPPQSPTRTRTLRGLRHIGDGRPRVSLPAASGAVMLRR